MRTAPTIGRKVWFYEPGCGDPREQDATVIDVRNDGEVSLFVVNRNGHQQVWHDIPLIQEADPLPVVEGHQFPYCKWMPYQQAQAAKAAAEEGMREVVIDPAGEILSVVKQPLSAPITT